MRDDLAGQGARRAVLVGGEAGRRKVMLVRLQDALAAQGVESVVVGRHLLTLRGAGPGQPSRPGEPELHVLGPDRHRVVTTDGWYYRFADSCRHPADDPGGAAGCVLSADVCGDAAGRQALAPVTSEPGGRDDAVVGAGERALRQLRDDGVI
jgi:hypothetical protein